MSEEEEIMHQSHYSLRWNNHQSTILAAFEALLHAECLVDVTLVCGEVSIKAHKVVLSACSPYFRKMISQNPCEHPIIILRDYEPMIVQAVVDFMYKGEISIAQEELPNLMRVAKSLKVRGLYTNSDSASLSEELKEISATNNNNSLPAHHHHHHTPPVSPSEYDRQFQLNDNNKYSTSTTTTMGRSSPISPLISNSFDQSSVKLPHMSRLTFPEAFLPRADSESPIPRRKQARPTRRSCEMSSPHDLSTKSDEIMMMSNLEESAENLCINKENEEIHHLKATVIKSEEDDINNRSTPSSELHHHLRSPEIADLSTQSSSGNNNKEFRSSPISAHHQPPAINPMNLKQEMIDNSQSSSLPFPPLPPLGMTPSHSKYFGLDTSLPFIPPGLENCRNPIFDMPETRNIVESNIYGKKKMGRPKGQHSAPRGGPPRSWTNQELTEALAQVWNKKMTTSQASRIFGIPYNSLLMYVRGKYGKSLKLEQLRKDCIGGMSPSVDILVNMGNHNNNNNNVPKISNAERNSDTLQPNTRPSSTEHEPQQAPTHHSLFNPFHPAFYNDFGAGFPIPVNMLHLLPMANEKHRPEHASFGNTTPNNNDDENSKKINNPSRPMETDDESTSGQDLYRSAENLYDDDRRELVKQNGQN